MERQYKRSFKAYSAWNYQREIEDLNKESEKGWQLIKGGCFHSKFIRNLDVCYRYQLDYPGKIEDMGRYIETYREQGWEYINSTFNGWYFFRKLYDPSLPEEEYEIFTDRSSIKEMNGRWAKIAIVLSVMLLVLMVLRLVHFIQKPMLPAIVQLITFVFVMAVFIRGIVIMRNPDKSKNVRWDGILLGAFLTVLIAGNFASILLIESRPYLDSVYISENVKVLPEEIHRGIEWNSIEIQYGDHYYIDVEIEADAPVCFSIVNEDGTAVYAIKDSSVQESDVQVYLKKGVYKMFFSDYPGGKLNVTFDIE